MEHGGRSCQPGVLVPLVLGGMLAADAALRAVPLDRVSYRVWEAMRTFGAETPFRPDARYDRPRVYGNLAALGNQRDLREYHRVVFTTDALGYHNPPQLATGGGVRALLFGSSFSAGTEANDDESLAVRLTTLTGQPVYNAAPGEPAPARVRALAQRVGMHRGVVVFEYVESSEPPPIAAAVPNPRALRCRAALGTWDVPLTCDVLTWATERLAVSALQVFAARLYRRAQDDRLLPNAAAARVIRTRLMNGAEVLFFAGERSLLHRERDARTAERPFAWLAQQLALQGHDLLVVLLPQKYSVYARLLAEPDPGPEASLAYLAELERRLSRRGIAVVNLTEPLRTAAGSALDRGALIYWRDDTHWNAEGVAVAAQAIARQWPAGVRDAGRAAPSGRR